MIGIYIIKNTINDKVYIGQSININQRWNQHKYAAKNDFHGTERNNQIHTAMRKLGVDNFYIEVLEECTREELSEKEKYWIAYYNSFKNGYNGTMGGELYEATKEEDNGRALLSKEDVTYIRECYNNHVPFRKVYEIFKNKITKRGLQHVWHFETWPEVKSEYNTEENKYWHSHQAKANPSEVASNNKRHFTNEEVLKMREEYANGKGCSEIWREYYPELAKSTVYNAIKGKAYKDVK